MAYKDTLKCLPIGEHFYAEFDECPYWGEVEDALRDVPDAATLMERELHCVNNPANDLPFPIAAIGGC